MNMRYKDEVVGLGLLALAIFYFYFVIKFLF